MRRSRPFTFVAPEIPLHRNLSSAAERYPDSPAVHFLGRSLTYRDLDVQVSALAAWLQNVGGLQKGDRVALYMQNSPQWLISFYAVMRSGGIVVPVSPMNRRGEVGHYLQDSGASILIVAGELVETALGALEHTSVRRLLVTSYSDYIDRNYPLALPDWLTAEHHAPDGAFAWRDALAADLRLAPVSIGPDDVCALPYTSGSTGKPKACIHTHRSLMHTAAGMTYWHGIVPGDVALGAAPMYHVSGLCHGVTSPIFAGAAVAIIPRWNRDLSLDAMERHRVTHASLPPTAVVDLLGAPDIDKRDLSALRRMSSGGAAMPEAVWTRLRDTLGVSFLEAYGMTETAATTHLNPPEAPRLRCLGIPFFGTKALIVNSETLEPMPVGEIGEILLSGPQLFRGYWNKDDETARAIVDIDGQRYLRSGDIGYVDADGYYYMTDRAKRMINASGLKVWPTEIESVLYAHPGIREACVIAAPDPYRGETVKALVVLQPDAAGNVSEADLIAWCRARMAAYKYPRIVEFVESLPKSPAGKILWRELQDKEMSRVPGHAV